MDLVIAICIPAELFSLLLSSRFHSLYFYRNTLCWKWNHRIGSSCARLSGVELSRIRDENERFIARAERLKSRVICWADFNADRLRKLVWREIICKTSHDGEVENILATIKFPG